MENSVDFKVIKEKIIKTDNVLRMFSDLKNKNADLKKTVQQTYKKYKQSVNDLAVLNLECERKLHQSEEGKKENERIKVDYEKLSYEYSILKQEHDNHIDELQALQMKYQSTCQQLIDCKASLQEYQNIVPVLPVKIEKKRGRKKKCKDSDSEKIDNLRSCDDSSSSDLCESDEEGKILEMKLTREMENENTIEKMEMKEFNSNEADLKEQIEQLSNLSNILSEKLKKTLEEKVNLNKHWEEKVKDMEITWLKIKQQLTSEVDELKKRLEGYEKERSQEMIRNCEIQIESEKLVGMECKSLPALSDFQYQEMKTQGSIFDAEINDSIKCQEKIECTEINLKQQTTEERSIEIMENIMIDSNNLVDSEKSGEDMNPTDNNLMKQEMKESGMEIMKKDISDPQLVEELDHCNEELPFEDIPVDALCFQKQENTNENTVEEPLNPLFNARCNLTSLAESEKSDNESVLRSVYDILIEMRVPNIVSPMSPFGGDLISIEENNCTDQSPPPEPTDENSPAIIPQISNTSTKDVSNTSQNDGYREIRKKKQKRLMNLLSIKKAKQMLWLKKSQLILNSEKRKNTEKLTRNLLNRENKLVELITNKNEKEVNQSENSFMDGVVTVLADLVCQKLKCPRPRKRLAKLSVLDNSRNVLEVNKMLLEKARTLNSTVTNCKDADASVGTKDVANGSSDESTENKVKILERQEDVDVVSEQASSVYPSERSSSGGEVPIFDSCYESQISNPPSIEMSGQDSSKETTFDDKRHVVKRMQPNEITVESYQISSEDTKSNESELPDEKVNLNISNQKQDISQEPEIDFLKPTNYKTAENDTKNNEKNDETTEIPQSIQLYENEENYSMINCKNTESAELNHESLEKIEEKTDIKIEESNSVKGVDDLVEENLETKNHESREVPHKFDSSERTEISSIIESEEDIKERSETFSSIQSDDVNSSPPNSTVEENDETQEVGENCETKLHLQCSETEETPKNFHHSLEEIEEEEISHSPLDTTNSKSDMATPNESINEDRTELLEAIQETQTTIDSVRESDNSQFDEYEVKDPDCYKLFSEYEPFFSKTTENDSTNKLDEDETWFQYCLYDLQEIRTSKAYTRSGNEIDQQCCDVAELFGVEPEVFTTPKMESTCDVEKCENVGDAGDIVELGGDGVEAKVTTDSFPVEIPHVSESECVENSFENASSALRCYGRPRKPKVSSESKEGLLEAGEMFEDIFESKKGKSSEAEISANSTKETDSDSDSKRKTGIPEVRRSSRKRKAPEFMVRTYDLRKSPKTTKDNQMEKHKSIEQNRTEPKEINSDPFDAKNQMEKHKNIEQNRTEPKVINSDPFDAVMMKELNSDWERQEERQVTLNVEQENEINKRLSETPLTDLKVSDMESNFDEEEIGSFGKKVDLLSNLSESSDSEIVDNVLSKRMSGNVRENVKIVDKQAKIVEKSEVKKGKSKKGSLMKKSIRIYREKNFAANSITKEVNTSKTCEIDGFKDSAVNDRLNNVDLVGKNVNIVDKDKLNPGSDCKQPKSGKIRRARSRSKSIDANNSELTIENKINTDCRVSSSGMRTLDFVDSESTTHDKIKYTSDKVKKRKLCDSNSDIKENTINNKLTVISGKGSGSFNYHITFADKLSQNNPHATPGPLRVEDGVSLNSTNKQKSSSCSKQGKISILQEVILRPSSEATNPAKVVIKAPAQMRTSGFKRPNITKIIPPCPQSPPPPSAEECVPDAQPVIIPLEKPSKMEITKATALFRKLIMYSGEEKTVEEVARHFIHQEADHIANLILEQISRDTDKPNAEHSPAPVMTDTQRVLFGFMLKLEQMNIENLIDSYLKSSELRLLKAQTLQEVNSITRLHVAICKYNRYIERMRRFCCDAFYFMGDLAVPFFFIVLSSWIEILPKEADSANFFLARVLVQLVNLKVCDIPGYNLLPLRNLLSKYYMYPTEPWGRDSFFQELFNNYLKNPVRPGDFAILLYCKNNTGKWVYEKINTLIKPILSNIKNDNFKATVIILIGNIVSQLHVKLDGAYVESVRDWLKNILAEEDVSEVVNQSIVLALRKIAKPKQKPEKVGILEPKIEKT